MKRLHLPWLVLAIEVVLGAGLIAWRVTRPIPPLPDLARMPQQTADDLRRLHAATWTDQPSRWLELGEAYLALGYFAEAEPCLARAAAKQPRFYPAQYAYASSLERLGRLDEAIIVFQQASELAEGRAAQNCQFRLARNALRIGKEAIAEAAFGRALSYPPARVAHLRFLVRKGRAEEALPILQQLRNERDLDILTEMAAVELYRALGRTPEMHAAAERADRAQPRFQLTGHWDELQPIRKRYGTMAAFARVEAHLKVGQRAEAADEFDRLTELIPADFLESMLPSGARVNLVAGRPQRGVALMEMLSQRQPLNPANRHLYGLVLAEAGSQDAAIRVLTQANGLQSEADSQELLVKLHEARSQLDSARTAAVAARLQRGIDLYAGNQLDLALTELEAATRGDPNDPRGWYYIGLVLAARENVREARMTFEKCLQLDPDHGRAKAALARLH